MQTHTNPYLRAHRRAAAGSAATAPWRKLLAGFGHKKDGDGLRPLAEARGHRLRVAVPGNDAPRARLGQ